MSLQPGEGVKDLNTTGLCLLSLDGGGVRGLSTLYVLRDIMEKINYEREKMHLESANPCDVFDLIGGTSTGGLIAIMLGRLRMSVEECITEYIELMKNVFGGSTQKHTWLVSFRGRVQSRFDSTKLSAAIEKVITDRGLLPSEPLNNGNNDGCRVFVCTVAKSVTTVTRFRSYRSRRKPSLVEPTILQAALATSAATSFFDPVKIQGYEFVDGALGANNPISEVESEATDLWATKDTGIDELIKCIVSIGTGQAELKAIPDMLPSFIKTLSSIATETEETARNAGSRWRRLQSSQRYFRFNVDQGLQNVGLEEYKAGDRIAMATHRYLTNEFMVELVDQCIENLKCKRKNDIDKAPEELAKDFLLKASSRNTSTNKLSQQAFKNTAKSFLDELNNATLTADILNITSLDQVWEVVDTLQRSQVQMETLRDLAMIGPFLQQIEEYSVAIHHYVGVKNEILLLIWAPIAILLRYSATLPSAFDAVKQSLASIGEMLPAIAAIKDVVGSEDKIRELLCVFFGDILDYYVVMLRLFQLPSWNIFFDSLWQEFTIQVEATIGHIGTHASLARSEVSIQDIAQTQAATVQATSQIEREHKLRRTKEFNHLRDRISPYPYNDKLELAQEGICEGTSAWLIRNKLFTQWMNISDRSVPLLWLHGIPGSGKTYMAAAVAAHIGEKKTCLKIFANYEYQSKLKAKSILQSLLFQAANNNPNLQLILAGLDENELQNSTQKLTELLVKILQFAGPTYIVIDGLDEIHRDQREILLRHVVHLAHNGQQLKIMISSQREADISSSMFQKSHDICLEEENSASIDLYVQKRAQDLIQSFDHDLRAQEEMKRHLDSILLNAKGMFIYVRIVMDHLSMLDDLQEVHQYLEVLPSELDLVYQRIVQRLHSTTPMQREKTRKILSWLCSTPVPMTILEIGQAILVRAGEQIREVNSTERFVNLCRPVVEPVDGHLRFVHQTFKFYIENSNFEHSINIMDANRNLLFTCLNYLCADIFHTSTSDEAIKTGILEGKYRFYPYASRYWVQLIRELVRNRQAQETCADIGDALQLMANSRGNTAFTPYLITSTYLPKLLNENWPKDAQKCLEQTIRFLHDERWSDWTFDTYQTWDKFDPLTLSEMGSRIHISFSKLLHEDTVQALLHEGGINPLPLLHRHYGPKIFKCEFPSCPMSREGFKGPKEWNNHITLHSRPWKCRNVACQFTTIGFLSKHALYSHESTCLFPQHDFLSETEDIDIKSLKILLYETVRRGDITQLKQVLLHPQCIAMQATYKGLKHLYNIATLAAMQASKDMIEILFPLLSPYWGCICFAERNVGEEGLVLAVVKNEDLNCFKWLLLQTSQLRTAEEWNKEHVIQRTEDTKEMRPWYKAMVKAVMKTEIEDIYAEWEDFVFMQDNPLLEDCSNEKEERWRLLLPAHPKSAVIFAEPVFHGTKNNLQHEERLKRTWARFASNGPINPIILGSALRNLAKSSFSINLAQELLRLGAEVNFPLDCASVPDTEYSGATALQLAAKSKTSEAAFFMKYLLEHGANPYLWRGKLSLKEQEGPKNIRKHLGMTWNQVLKEFGWEQCRKKISRKDNPTKIKRTGVKKRRPFVEQHLVWVSKAVNKADLIQE